MIINRLRKSKITSIQDLTSHYWVIEVKNKFWKSLSSYLIISESRI